MIFHCQLAGQQLSINDLLVVMEELNDVRAKWYNIGLQLRMSVGTLDAIKEQYDDPSHCLRETLKTWLKTSPSAPTWTNIVDALRSSTVGEVRLAADLQNKYCLSIPVSHTSVIGQPSTPQLQASATASPPHPIVPLLLSPITDDFPDAPSTPQHSSAPHSPTPMHTGKSLVAISFLATAMTSYSQYTEEQHLPPSLISDHPTPPDLEVPSTTQLATVTTPPHSLAQENSSMNRIDGCYRV